MKTPSLETLLFILCIALRCVSGAVVRVSGYEGGDTNVSCPYAAGYESYEKYLCSSNCGDEDVLVTTTEAKKNKYSIYDDRKKRVFTTTISELRSTDAGTYWCGVTRNGKDYYPAEVKLDVVPGSCCDESTKVHMYEGDSVNITCVYDSEYRHNLKYICRGNQPSTCLQQAVTTSDIKQSRNFRLIDDNVSNKFTVTITSLTQNDSGSYLCGVKRNTGLDVFSAVELEVREWCCVRSNNLSGTVGLPLSIHCPFPPQHRTNTKFLCNGDNRNNCTHMVNSQDSNRTDLRFTLRDDASSSSFLVTITELRAGDAGTYWCGSDSQWSAGNYTKIQLFVVFPTSTVTSAITVESQSSDIPGKSIKDASHLHPVVFILPAVLLLILTFALVIVYKYKCNKVQGVGVTMKRNMSTNAEEVMGEADIYENQNVAVCSKWRTSKQQSTCNHNDDTSEDQQEADYENITSAENIYCNEFSSKYSWM